MPRLWASGDADPADGVIFKATQLGGEGTEDLFILQEHWVDTPRQLWKIELTSHGSYKIKAKSSEPYDSDLVMVAANMVNGSSNGIQVQQRLYVDNESYKDEWILMRIGVASPVELEGQLMSNWCWVTCARMFAKHYFPTVSRTQNQAVTFLKGQEVDEQADSQTVREAIEYYIGNIEGASISTANYVKEIYTEEMLLRLLDDGCVVHIIRGYYSDDENSNSRLGGHSTLIFGYVIIDSEYRFLVKDPLPIGEGQVYTISYEKLCNGQNAKADEYPDLGIWTASVVEDTSYDHNTIPYHFNQ